jgi:hypothetical protein
MLEVLFFVEFPLVSVLLILGIFDFVMYQIMKKARP